MFAKANLKRYQSILGNHLRVKHSISGSVSTVTQKEDTVKQTSIKEAFGVTQPLPQTKKKALDRAIEDHVVQGLHALLVVDKPSFENI